MANRNAVKGAIVTKNVPTVTNAILTDMLNAEMNDNLRFREDYASSQTVTTPDPITGVVLDFTGIDRIDLTRTGGNTVLSVSGMGDGEEKYLRFVKSAGSTVAWTGVTDITGDQTNVTAAGVVVYQIIRKGTTYLTQAFVAPVIASLTNTGVTRYADNSEVLAGTETALAISPYTLTTGVPAASYITPGRIEIATQTEVNTGTDEVRAVCPKTLKPTTDRVAVLEGKKLVYSETTGVISVAGSATAAVTITHNLGYTGYRASAMVINSATIAGKVVIGVKGTNTMTIGLLNDTGSTMNVQVEVMLFKV